MPSKNTLTDVFCCGRGIAQARDRDLGGRAVDQVRPVWGRFLEDLVVGHRLARPRLQGIVLTDVGSLGLRLLKHRAVGDRGGAEQRGRDGDRLVDIIDGDRTGRHRCWNGRQQEQAGKLFGRATQADADTVAAPKPEGKGVENEELGKGFVWFAEMTCVKAPWPEGSE